ncbi:MAG: diguanylate cyclase [Candidatus Omnitrophota bacterium]
MSINAFIPFISACFSLGTGIYILRKAGKSYLSKPYFFAALTLFCYFLMHFGFIQFADNPELLNIWFRIFLSGACFSVPVLLNLLLIMRQRKGRLSQVVLGLSYLLSLSVFYFWFNGYPVYFQRRIGVSLPSLENLPYYVFGLNSFLFLPIGIIVNAIKLRSDKISELAKRQARFTILAILGIEIALILTFSAHWGIDPYPFSLILMIISFTAMSYSIVRFRFLEFDLIVNKTMSVFLFIGPLLLGHILITGLFLDTLGFFLATTFSVLIIVCLILFTPYKGLMQKSVEKIVYKGRYDYQTVLKELSQSLVAILDFDQLFDYMIHVIEQTMGVKKMAIFLEDDIAKKFMLRSSFGVNKEKIKNLNFNFSHGIIEKLKKESKILIRSELMQFEDSSCVNQYFDEFTNLDAELIAPLLYKDQLIGVMAFSQKGSGQIYNQGDIDVLEIFTQEAAKAIEHVRLYSEAIVDNSTKTFNQNYFLTRLREEIARSKRYGHAISLMFLEVDNQGQSGEILDLKGKDLLLKGIGLLLKTNVRNVDVLAHYGEKRFGVILPETAKGEGLNNEQIYEKHLKDTMIVANRLKLNINKFQNEYKNEKIIINLTIGFACFNGVDKKFTEEQFIKQAEFALTQAKKYGKIVLYQPAQEER